jgi:RNA polymerase sigma-70 factor (ECF subfamily)
MVPIVTVQMRLLRFTSSPRFEAQCALSFVDLKRAGGEILQIISRVMKMVCKIGGLVRLGKGMGNERDSPASADPADADKVTASDSTGRAVLVERLFREHNESLLRFLTARLRSPQDAREVAQEAYVRILSLDEPGAVSYLRAFLFRTAANLAVDRLRRNDVRQNVSSTALFGELDNARTPEREVAGTQAMERLARLVAALPWPCRRAFVLSRVHGMDFADIARELNVSERSARAYVTRALLHCRARLDKEIQG